MKLHLCVVGAFVASCALMVFGGCTDDTGTSTTNGSSSSSGAASSSSSSSGEGGGGTSSSSSSSSNSSGMSSSSSSSSSGSGGYQFCTDCTSTNSGAYTKECVAQNTACMADAECSEIFTCSFNGCTVDKDGGCCTRACTMGKSPASVALYYALDDCIYCKTCKSLCDDGAVSATDYCSVISPGGVPGGPYTCP